MEGMWTKVVLTGTLSLAVPGVSMASGRTWLAVNTAHFAIVSDAGEKTTRTIAFQFEQVRRAIENLWPWGRVDFDRPLLVVLVSDEAGMRALAPQYWQHQGSVKPASLFVAGADRYYIALRGDVRADDKNGINPYLVAYWSYIGLVIETAFQRNLPMWFSRGLSSVMSNSIARESQLDVGLPIPWELERVRQGPALTLNDLVKVDGNSVWYTQEDKLEKFDAECWAFVHYLLFADEGTHRSQFDRYMSLIRAGETGPGAIEAAFGKLDAMETGFRTYVGRRIMPYMQINLDVSLKPEGFRTSPVSAIDAITTRADLHAAMQRSSDARAAIAEARKIDPASAASYEVEGMLLDEEAKSDEALGAYTKAVELGSTRFHVHYRLAQLLWASSHRPEAEHEGHRALDLAATSAQRKKAQEFLDVANARTPPSTASASSQVLTSRDGVSLPRLLHEVRPNYTAPARDAKLAGTVVLECVVGADGSVSDVKVVRSLDNVHGLDEEAVNALKQWRFEPGTKNDKPVPVRITAEITFTLK